VPLQRNCTPTTEEFVFYLAMQSVLVLAQEAETTEPQGSALTSLLFIALIVGGGYFLFIRPQRKRVQAMEAVRNSVEVGSEVRTVGGIFGTVVVADDEIIVLDTGEGSRLRIARRAIAETIGGTAEGEAEDAVE
jgi:preprotein translocase subunit YajC